MGYKIKGFDELEKQLKDLGKRAEELDGEKVSFDELFTTSFMKQYTNFQPLISYLKQAILLLIAKKILKLYRKIYLINI